MKKSEKGFIALCLAVILAFACIPETVRAEEVHVPISLYIGTDTFADSAILDNDDIASVNLELDTPLNEQGELMGALRGNGYVLDKWQLWSYDSSTLHLTGGQSLEVPANGSISDVQYNGLTGNNIMGLLVPIYSLGIDKEATENGTFTIQSGGEETSSASAGETIDVVPVPAEGYQLNEITVTKTDDPNTQISVEDKSFTMPAYPVTVSVTFQKLSFEVTLPEGIGYIATSQQASSVEFDDSYIFTVIIANGYEASSDFSVTSNGDVLTGKKVFGNVYIYVIEHVTADQNIVVSGIREKRTPGNPDTPEIPDNPGNPNTPGTPDNSGNPNTPGTPDNPGNPNTPGTPDDSGNPNAPETPEHPQEPDTPVITDNVPPKITITLNRDNSWNVFSPSVSFGSYFRKNQNFTVSVTDTETGVKEGSVKYYLADKNLFASDKAAPTQEIEEKISVWTDYTGKIPLTREGNYVLYVKAEDNYGNVSYANTGGIVIDMTAPVISGIENGKTYYGKTSFVVKEKHLGAVILDGKPVKVNGSKHRCSIAADNKLHKVTVIDLAGNQITYKFYVKETWLRDGISSSGEFQLESGNAYKLGSGKWKVAGDNTVYEGNRTVYVTKNRKFDFQKQ